MPEEWKIKGKLLQELDALRDRIAQLEQSELRETREEPDISGTMFDHIVEGVLLIDEQTRQPLTGNRSMCAMLCCKRDEIANLRFQDVYPPEASDNTVGQANRQASGRPLLACNVPVKRNDGSIFFADITSVPFTLAGKKYILSVYRKINPAKTESTRPQSVPNDGYEHPRLTGTEINILTLIVNGMSNREIAQLLRRSTRTIENHRAHLMKKLGVDNSIELVRRAVSLGLVDLPVEPQ